MKLSSGKLRGDIANGDAVLEGHDAGERNEMPHGEHFPRIIFSPAEAVKDAAQFAAVRAHHFQGVLPRIALMNHDIEAELDCEIELLLEEAGLSRLVGAIVDPGLDFLLRLALQCAREDLHVFALRGFGARQAMVIKAGFSDRDDARAPRELAQRRHDVLRRFV